MVFNTSQYLCHIHTFLKSIQNEYIVKSTLEKN